MMPAPTMVFMKLKEALGTELLPSPAASPPPSTATEEFSTDAFKGASSSVPWESDIAASSCCRPPLPSSSDNDGM